MVVHAAQLEVTPMFTNYKCTSPPPRPRRPGVGPGGLRGRAARQRCGEGPHSVADGSTGVGTVLARAGAEHWQSGCVGKEVCVGSEAREPVPAGRHHWPDNRPRGPLQGHHWSR